MNELAYSLILFVLALGMAVTLLGARQSPLVPFGLAMPQWAAAVAVTPRAGLDDPRPHAE